MITINTTKQQELIIYEYSKFKGLKIDELIINAIYEKMQEENYYLLNK